MKNNLKKENERLKKELKYTNNELFLLKSLLHSSSLMLLVAYDLFLYKKKTGKSFKI